MFSRLFQLWVKLKMISKPGFAVTPGLIYLHRPTSVEYLVEDLIKFKLGKVWYVNLIVLYTNVKLGTRYARLIFDFTRHFQPKPDFSSLTLPKTSNPS